MKITSKTLMVSVETEVKLGNNDAIELTLQHQAFIYETKNGDVGIDLDLGVEVLDVKFLGIEIKNGYEEYKQFRSQLRALGIDLDELIDEKIKEIKDSGIEDKLKLMFKDKI